MNGINLILMIHVFPHIGFHCKLVPAQYRICVILQINWKVVEQINRFWLPFYIFLFLSEVNVCEATIINCMVFKIKEMDDDVASKHFLLHVCPIKVIILVSACTYMDLHSTVSLEMYHQYIQFCHFITGSYHIEFWQDIRLIFIPLKPWLTKQLCTQVYKMRQLFSL